MEPRKRSQLSRVQVASFVIALGCAIAVAGSGAATAQMIVYRAGEKVPESELADLGPPENLGGTVVSGDPKISARFDYGDGIATAGVFQATRGDVLIDFPFTEHATVIEGAVTLTDETGQTVRLLPGDSYLIKQDSLILWHVARSFVQKSFFSVVEQ